jgi:hypothetical protein
LDRPIYLAWDHLPSLLRPGIRGLGAFEFERPPEVGRVDHRWLLGAVFQFGPGLLGLDQFGQQLGLIIPGLVSPLAAALTCYLAGGVSEGADRKAWRNFGTGSLLYFFGNACYVYFSLSEIDAPFPTLPELSFFLMAVFFTIGMFQYGAAKHLITRIQTYNFGLIFSAVDMPSQVGWPYDRHEHAHRAGCGRVDGRELEARISKLHSHLTPIAT